MKIGDVCRVKSDHRIVKITGAIHSGGKEYLSCLQLMRSATRIAGCYSDHLQDELEPLGFIRKTEIQNLKDSREIVNVLKSAQDEILQIALRESKNG